MQNMIHNEIYATVYVTGSLIYNVLNTFLPICPTTHI